MGKATRKPGAKRMPARRPWLTLFGACVGLGIGAAAAGLSLVARDLPDLQSLEDYRPPITSHVYDTRGNLVARFYAERRTVVPAERIPAHVKHAFIAAEDANFYQHEGIDLAAVLASLINEVKVKLIGGARRGGSTITQQTAKTFLLSPEQTYTRKLKEMLLARRIEEELTKEEILHLYLNQIYFGHGAYGVEEAAQTYYSRGVQELTLGQAAALASIPKSPNRINPFADPARVRARRAYVLSQMKEHGLASAREVEEALAEPVRVRVSPPEFLDSAPHYAEAIRRILVERYGEAEVNQGGLKVYAALDARMQVAATRALQEGLRAVDKRQGWRGPVVRLDADDAKRLLTALDDERRRRFPAEETPALTPESALDAFPVWDLSKLTPQALEPVLSRTDDDDEDEPDAESDVKRGGERTHPPLRAVRTTQLRIGDILGAVVTDVDNAGKRVKLDLGTLEAALPFSAMQWARPYAPTRKTATPRRPSDVLKAGDIVRVRIERYITGRKDKAKRALKPWVEVSLEQEPRVEGALVAIDPHTHQVRALVGGYDFHRSSFNRATQAKRQPGSAFKPFIYAQGIESREFTPVGFRVAEGARLITDAPKVFFDRWTGKKWAPKNAGGTFRGDITMRTCLTYSVNTCSITILEQVGVEAVQELATRVGLNEADAPLPKNLTLALGTGEVRPIDLVNAYTVFPGGGLWAPPVLIEKVKRSSGETLEENHPAAREAISPATAYVLTDLMKSVVENGTATAARALGRPVAGKTGTTNLARSVWFTGFTPELVAGAYVGFDDNEPLGPREYGGKAALPIWLDFMREALRDQPARDFPQPEGVVRRVIQARTGLLAGETREGSIRPPEPYDASAAAADVAAAGELPADADMHATSPLPTPPSSAPPDGPLSPLQEALARVLGFVPGLGPARPDALPSASAPAPPPSEPVPLAETAVLDAPDEEPLVLPEGVISEVFLMGTEPTLREDEKAPIPLELLEGAGGLGP